MVKKVGSKFVVVDENGKKIAGPFKSQQSAEKFNTVAMRMKNKSKGK